MTDELLALQERVGAGIRWLTENDPIGVYHIWWSSGLTKLSPMPSQDAESVAAWRRYYDARRLWEALDAQLGKMEGETR